MAEFLQSGQHARGRGRVVTRTEEVDHVSLSAGPRRLLQDHDMPAEDVVQAADR